MDCLFQHDVVDRRERKGGGESIRGCGRKEPKKQWMKVDTPFLGLAAVAQKF